MPAKQSDPAIGTRFGRWIIIGGRVATGSPNAHILCRCDCGTERPVARQGLMGGTSLSCGCRKPEASATAAATHGDSRVGNRARLYRIWAAMRDRCSNPKTPCYARYGGRGIAVCEEWSKYEPFRDWALSNGYNERLTIDREDNDGNYDPGNCRWATLVEQRRNRRDAVLMEAFGEAKMASDWARDPRCRVPYALLSSRLKKGWGLEQAIVTPKTHRFHGQRDRAAAIKGMSAD
jgi:hypothetical protein